MLLSALLFKPMRQLSLNIIIIIRRRRAGQREWFLFPPLVLFAGCNHLGVCFQIGTFVKNKKIALGLHQGVCSAAAGED